MLKYIQVGDLYMKKNIFIASFILILVIIIIFFIFRKNDNVNTINKLNNNSGVIKDQVFENLNITNVSITIDDENVSTFSADVTNNSDDENNIDTIEIILKDKDGNILTSLIGYIGVGLKKGDVTKISAQTSIDLSKATSVEYKKVDK